MADLNHDELVKAFAAASIAANEHARAQVEAQKAVDDYAAASEKAAEEIQASSKKTKQALTDLSMAVGKSAVDFTKAMITGTEGTSKYAGAVTGAADAAGNAAQTMLVAFGPLGIIVGGVIKAFGALVGASLKQNDQLMKSYRELSDVGSVSGSLEKLQSDLNKVGLTSEEAEKFGKLLGKTAPDLASFGGSVSAGKDKFIGVFEGMIGVGNKTEIAMQRIGYSSDEMRDATADYVAKQSRLGLAQNKTAEQLRGESVKYMVTLRELGELTGMSRDEAQKLIDQQQADARWSMTLRQMTADGQGEEAQKLQAYMATYEKTFGKDAAAGLMEQIANKGAIVGEASAKAYTSTQGQAYEMAMKVAKDQVSMQEGLSQTAVGVRKNMEQLGPSFAVAGQGLANMTGDAQQINAAYAIESKKNIDVQGELAKTQKDGGKLLNANIDLEQKNRQMRIMADKALSEVTGVTVTVFQKLNDIVFSLGKTLARVIDGITGTELFGMTATDLSKSFRDLGDNAADMKSAAKEKASLVADIEKSKKEIATAEAAAADSTKNADQMKTQMREKEQLITDMQKEARKITDISLRKEAEANIAKEKFALKELNQQAFAASKGGKLDSSAIIDEKKKLLLEKQQKLAAEEEKLQKLEKEKSTLAPGGAGAASASAGSGAAAPAGAPSAKGGRGSQGNNGGMSYNEALGLPEAGKVLDFGSGSGSKSNFEAIEPGLKDKVVAAAAEFNEASGGKDKLKINSAKRDTADQQRLWDESVANGRPGIGPTGMIIGKPGTSKHEHGLAVDIQNYKDPAAAAALKKQGLVQPYPAKDPVHFEVPKAMEGGSFDGPSSGYPVELHGKNESVWPEEKLKATLAEVQKSSIEDYKKQLLGEMGMNSSTTSASTSSTSSGESDVSNRMMEMLTSKFDDMINQLESSNDTLRNLLTYAKA